MPLSADPNCPEDLCVSLMTWLNLIGPQFPCLRSVPLWEFIGTLPAFHSPLIWFLLTEDHLLSNVESTFSEVGLWREGRIMITVLQYEFLMFNVKPSVVTGSDQQFYASGQNLLQNVEWLSFHTPFLHRMQLNWKPSVQESLSPKVSTCRE